MNSIRRAFAPLLAVVLCGCATTPKEDPVSPLSREEATAFLARARSPQVFGITIYPTERGPVFVGGNRTHEGQETQLAFDAQATALAPMVSAGPGDLRALIDTSAADSWITLRAGTEGKVIPMTGPPPFRKAPAHVAERQSGYLSLLSRLKFDTLAFESALVYVRAAHGHLGALCRLQESPRPDLVVGCNILGGLGHVQFDFSGRSVLLAASSEPYIDDAAVLAIVPLKDAGGAVGCEGLIDGEPAVFILDTGGDFALAMEEPPAQPVHRLCIGDLVLRDTTALSHAELGLRTPGLPRIGRKILARFRVTIDFRNKLLYFERPPAPRAKPAAPPPAEPGEL